MHTRANSDDIIAAVEATVAVCSRRPVDPTAALRNHQRELEASAPSDSPSEEAIQKAAAARVAPSTWHDGGLVTLHEVCEHCMACVLHSRLCLSHGLPSQPYVLRPFKT